MFQNIGSIIFHLDQGFCCRKACCHVIYKAVLTRSNIALTYLSPQELNRNEVFFESMDKKQNFQLSIDNNPTCTTFWLDTQMNTRLMQRFCKISVHEIHKEDSFYASNSLSYKVASLIARISFKVIFHAMAIFPSFAAWKLGCIEAM